MSKAPYNVWNSYIDSSVGVRPVVVDEDGNLRTVGDLKPKGCTAREGKLRCILDNSHQLLKSSHIHRETDESGRAVLTAWRKTDG